MGYPLVSVIIPCYNSGPWLRMALDSVFAQSYPSIEAILIDDGSTDDSLQIAREYQKQGLKIIEQGNAGASAARNAGLRAASGHYVQHLDADDALSPDKIAAQVDLLSDLDGEYVASSEWARFTSTTDDAVFLQRPVYRDFAPTAYLIDSVAKDFVMHPAAWLVPMSLVRRAGAWDERLSLNDDAEFFARQILKSEGVRFCSQGCSYYRSYLLGSLSHRRDRAARESRFLSMELISGHLLEATGNDERARQAAADLYKSFVRLMYPSPRDLIRLAEERILELVGAEQVPKFHEKFRYLAVMLLRRQWVRFRRFTSRLWA